MPTRPDSPDPAGPAGAAHPFATWGEGLGKGMDFFQDWMKAAGSALPHVSGTSAPMGTGIPGWTVPTLDPAELDKRIQELRTVQFWLEQNARMIGMTIQGLEVQRMTLNTLQGMNVSMDQLKDALKVQPQAMHDLFKAATHVGAGRDAEAPAPAGSPPERSDAATAATAATSAEAATPPASAAAATAPPARAPLPASSWFQGVPDEPEPPPTSEAAGDDAAPAALPEGADLINPMRWWDTLTQQFSHLASQAVPPALRPAAASAQGAAASTPDAAANNAASASAADPAAASASARPAAGSPARGRRTPPSAPTSTGARPSPKARTARAAVMPSGGGSDATPATPPARSSAARGKAGR